MKDSVTALLERVAQVGGVRSAVDRAFHRRARVRTARLDVMSIESVQKETLLRLVRANRHTRFGSNHGFQSIRSVAEYQRRVPLRSYEDFWKEYWQPAFPQLNGATWHRAIPYFALTSGTTAGKTKYVPVSRAMLRSNRAAALTCLSWLLASRPELTLFRGRFFFLGGSTDLKRLDGLRPWPQAGDLSAIASKEVASVLRPFTFPPLGLALMPDWDAKLDELAARSVRLPITVLSGVPSWMLALFERLRMATGKERISEIWPALQALIHGGVRFDPYAKQFRRQIGDDRVAFVETYAASEGFIASEDPRFGALRLISDLGIFYEFVPVEELDAAVPIRHAAWEVVPGARYAIVMTTCAGLWSYVLGDQVTFESRDPPLLRFSGRTRQALSAFGEHLIGEEVEQAIAAAADSIDNAIVDFHVGPEFPVGNEAAGRHHYLIEFVRPVTDLPHFGQVLDRELGRLNEDYASHRVSDVTLRHPRITIVPPGGFLAWMRERGQLGGQHKVIRIDPMGKLTAQLEAWIRETKGKPIR